MQFTGRSTYILSLPKRWIEGMHLKAGEEAYRSTFYVLRNLVIAIQKIRVLCKMGLKTNIQAIEDGVLTAIEKDRCLTPVTSSYL